MKKISVLIAITILFLAKAVFFAPSQPLKQETKTDIATKGTNQQSPSFQAVLATDSGSLTFDVNKFKALGFPAPQDPDPVKLDPKGLALWKQYAMPAAVKAAQITGVDVGLIGFWSFSEGVNYDMAANTCGGGNTPIGVNGQCATDNWQGGNFAVQPGQQAGRLQAAFDAMYGNHDDATVQKVGQSVIDAVAQRTSSKVTYPASTFPKVSLQSLVSNMGDPASRAWVGLLMDDDQIGAYVLAMVWKDTGLNSSFADNILYGYGSKQNIINIIKAVYDAGISATGSLGTGGGSSGSYTLSLTLRPKTKDSWVINYVTANGVGGDGSSSTDNSTGDASGIIGWAEKITAALKPALWEYYNQMEADICNSSKYCATKQTGASENDLYWCTWLVFDAYNLAGYKGLNQQNAGSVVSEAHTFASTSGLKYLPYDGSNGKSVLPQVKPGYAFILEQVQDVFTNNEHTGLVKSISVDSNGNGSIVSLEADSDKTTHTFPIEDWQVKNVFFPLRGFGGY